MLIRQKCPICGNEANQDLPGPDGITLCRVCSKCGTIIVKEFENGAAFTCDFVSSLRRRLKLASEIDGISETYTYEYGKHWLMWIALPGKVKVFINQYIDGVPIIKPPEQEEFEMAKDGETLLVRHLRKVGRPVNTEVDNAMLLDLIFDKAMSYRDSSKYLEEVKGIHMSYEGIRKRVEDMRKEGVK